MFLELLLIIANIGTAVAPYPVLKRQNEPLALGYVAARIVESTFILVGIIAVLGIVTLQRDDARRERRAPSRTRSRRSRTGRSCSGPALSSE